MEELVKITFEEADQKAVVTVIGEGTTMESASVEFEPKISSEKKSLAVYLALKFVEYMSEE